MITEAVNTKFDGQSATLEITNCKKEQEGTYTISASNAGGTTESSSTIRIGKHHN